MSPQTLGRIFTWMPFKGSTPTTTLNQMTAGTALRQNLSVMIRPALRSTAVAPNKAAASLHSIHRHSKQPSELCQSLLHTMQAMTTTAFLLHPPHPQDSITRLLPSNFSTTLRWLRLLHWPSTTTMPLWLSTIPGLCRPTVSLLNEAHQAHADDEVSIQPRALVFSQESTPESIQPWPHNQGTSTTFSPQQRHTLQQPNSSPTSPPILMELWKPTRTPHRDASVHPPALCSPQQPRAVQRHVVTTLLSGFQAPQQPWFTSPCHGFGRATFGPPPEPWNLCPATPNPWASES